MELLYREIDKVPLENVFLWIHLPHVLLGRVSYGDDVDLLDNLVGYIRERYGDDSIYLTADHGHMNGFKGKWVYGFDVYEPAIRIPLITPRINDLQKIGFPTSNTQLRDIILGRNIEKRDFVLSDSAYYAQPYRKLAVIEKRFKYIFNKYDKSEELFDLEWDERETVNLLECQNWDLDRKRQTNIQEVYFYPYRTEVAQKIESFRGIRNEIWRNGTIYEETQNRVKRMLIKTILRPITKARLKQKGNRK